jgi:hypothetical protein
VWSSVNQIVNTVFDLWLWPVNGLAPVWQVFYIALPVTVIALLVFRFASNQDGITGAKNKIKAYLLELWLYKDDIGILLRAQGQVLRYSLIYMRFSLVPMAIMMVPFVFVIIQLESQFAFRGLEPGEPAILMVTVDSETPVGQLDADLSLPAALVQETPALRSDRASQVLWRISADGPGRHMIKVRVGDAEVIRQLVVGDERKLWPTAYRGGDWRVLGSAAEAALPASGDIAMTEISYPRARAEFLGLSSASWLLLGFSIILGFLLRGMFGVTF